MQKWDLAGKRENPVERGDLQLGGRNLAGKEGSCVEGEPCRKTVEPFSKRRPAGRGEPCREGEDLQKKRHSCRGEGNFTGRKENLQGGEPCKGTLQEGRKTVWREGIQCKLTYQKVDHWFSKIYQTHMIKIKDVPDKSGTTNVSLASGRGCWGQA